MQDCIQKVVAALHAGNSPDLQERLLEAALLIEKFRGWSSYRGISPAVDTAELTPASISELRASLIEFAQRYPQHPDVGTSIWALGKLGDESLRPFFVTEMRRHLQARRHHPVQQADAALEALGDGVRYDYAPGKTDHNEYFEAVRLYLTSRAA